MFKLLNYFAERNNFKIEYMIKVMIYIIKRSFEKKQNKFIL